MQDHGTYRAAAEPADIAPHVRELEAHVAGLDDAYDPAVTVREGRVELRTGTALGRTDREATEALLAERMRAPAYGRVLLTQRVSWPDPAYEIVLD